MNNESIKEPKQTSQHLSDEAFHSRSRFMAKVSHDLRSPLNGIIGFAELMYHGKVGPISSDHKAYLGDILTSARQLLMLVNDVIDFDRVESGKMQFNPEKVDLQKILNETQDIFQGLINEKNIQFKMELDPKIKTVFLDPARFKQVIYNYVSNALKCTGDEGSVTVRIKKHSDETLCLEVEDTGIGIRKEDLNRLFIEFEQLDSAISKKYPSSGLGLALTKQIVEAQQGTVGVESTFGKGSKFYAIIPCVKPEKNE